jgi:threonine aldolase
VESDGVFAQVPRQAIAKLQKRYFFFVWDESRSLVRWMYSFDTTERDVRLFAKFVAETVQD